jgi:hypothetical protein
MTTWGLVSKLMALASLAAPGAGVALRFWLMSNSKIIEPTRENLLLHLPHLKLQRRHTHPMVRGDAPPRWGTQF